MTSRMSKFKNLSGEPHGRTPYIENVKFTSCGAADSNLLSANSKFVAVNWESVGGGSFAVIPVSQKCKLPDVYPVYNGHETAVLETEFNPFNDNILASGSDDGKINVWNIPNEPIKETQTTPLIRLSRTLTDSIGSVSAGEIYGHHRRIFSLQFHPVAANVLGSCSMDGSFKVWDVERATFTSDHSHPEGVYSFSYSFDGSSVVTSCRDKCYRLLDTRTVVDTPLTANGNGVPKCARVSWLGNSPYVASAGSRRDGARGLQLWDSRAFEKPVVEIVIDRQGGVMFPYFDFECNLLYVSGKGTGATSFFEYSEGSLNALGSYRSTEDTKGIAFAPKSCVGTSNCEVTRAYRALATAVEKISFTVLRKAAGFQSDLYPPTRSLEPTLTADDFLYEKITAFPKLIPMNTISSSMQSLVLEANNSPKRLSPLKSSSTPESKNSIYCNIEEHKNYELELVKKEEIILSLQSEIETKIEMINALKEEVADLHAQSLLKE